MTRTMLRHRLRWNWSSTTDDSAADINVRVVASAPLPGRQHRAVATHAGDWTLRYPRRLQARLLLCSNHRSRLILQPGFLPGWRHLFTGPITAAALAQRGALVLHAATVRHRQSGQIFLLLGPSGTGKSTLATATLTSGHNATWQALGDDIAPLMMDETPTAAPPQLTLLAGMAGPRRWRHDLTSDTNRSWRPLHPSWHQVKYQGPTWPDPTGELPIHGIILLDRQQDAQLAPRCVPPEKRLAHLAAHAFGLGLQKTSNPAMTLQRLACASVIPQWKLGYAHTTAGPKILFDHLATML